VREKAAAAECDSWNAGIPTAAQRNEEVHQRDVLDHGALEHLLVTVHGNGGLSERLGENARERVWCRSAELGNLRLPRAPEDRGLAVQAKDRFGEVFGDAHGFGSAQISHAS